MQKEGQILEFSKRLENPESRYLLQCEQEKINALLPEYHGFYLVQLGVFDNYDLKSASTITHRIYVGKPDARFPKHKNIIESSLKELPFLSESVDLFFLPHTLEFLENSYELLSEIYHILIPGGRLVLLGFNPFSLLGLTKLLKSAKNNVWFGDLHAPRQVKNWLQACGYTIDYQSSFCFRPPLKNQYLLKKLKFLESVGRIFFPFCGGAYAIVAQKKIIPISSVKRKAYSKRIPVTRGLPEPSANKGL